jgi:YfiH family protein
VSKRVLCLSTTNLGGLSKNAFATLNLGTHVGDDESSVVGNRKKLTLALAEYANKAKAISWLNQTHSNQVISLSEPLSPGAIEADAAYTNIDNLPCTVMTADCMAIMVSNRRGTEVAAIHAGWKGLLDGVIENTISTFLSPREELHAWFAPSICQQHFEVGSELAFLFADYPSALIASTNTNKVLLDLVAVASIKLKSLGIYHQYYSNRCTYSSDILFSHRQATHQGLIACGRMANLILINNLRS